MARRTSRRRSTRRRRPTRRRRTSARRTSRRPSRRRRPTRRNARKVTRGKRRRISNKSLKKLIKSAHGQGWDVEYTGSGHVKFIPSDKDQSIVIASATPSDRRSIDNLRSQLRRSGLVLARNSRRSRGVVGPDFAVGDVLVVERQPVYESAATPSYKVTRKTIRQVDKRLDRWGDPYWLVRVHGSNRVFRLSEGRHGREGWWSFVASSPRPLRYYVIEHH